MILIDGDVGGVVKDLQELDPHLRVRFAEAGNPPYWAVSWESDDKRDTYLVTTVQAHQTASGTWTGLDQRLVEHIRSIDGHGRRGYDYSQEVIRRNEQAEQARRQRFHDQVEPFGEIAAHALRKDLGVKNRAFIKG